MATAKDPCQRIRDDISTTEKDILEAEEVLPELRGPAKKVLEEFIKRERLHLRRLQNALRACEASKR